MADNPWAWRDGHNPYRATPFQVLAIGPDVSGRGAIRNHVRKRRQRIERRADRYPLFGRTLRVAEVNAAEERIKDPALRLPAQLCTHWPAPPARAEWPEPPERAGQSEPPGRAERPDRPAEPDCPAETERSDGVTGRKGTVR